MVQASIDNYIQPVIRDGSRPLHKGPGKLPIKQRETLADELFERHFGMQIMSPAAIELENYCARKENPTTSQLIWTECSCGTKYLACDDYICRSCRASL